MTKEEWIKKYRQERIIKRKLVSTRSLTHRRLSLFFKSYYGHIYLEQETVFIRLVQKYRDRLDQKHLIIKLNLIRTWRKPARERGRELMKNLVYAKNPFLSLIKKMKLIGIRAVPSLS